MKQQLILLLLVLAVVNLNSQTYFDISFNGKGTVNPQIILVNNITKGTSVNIQGTDILRLKIINTGVQQVEFEKNELTIFPNPMINSCYFEFLNTQQGRVKMQLHSFEGKLLYSNSRDLPYGKQRLLTSGLSAGLYMLSVSTPMGHISGCFVSKGQSGANCNIMQVGEIPSQQKIEINTAKSSRFENSIKSQIKSAIVEMNYSIADELEFIGSANGYANTTIYASPNNNQTFNFQFNKPRYIWIDAAANFPDFANSKANIARDLALAKDAGFTDIVVEVRPTTGDVLFKSNVVDQVKFMYAWQSGGYTKVNRTATWDYLQAFIDEGHRLGLKIHAAINTFSGGNTINGGTGVLYRDNAKQEWATQLNTSAGIVSVMNTTQSAKFFNPVNEEVQTYLCNILADLAKYDIDGIFLDRGRFLGLQSDFSDYTRNKFEAYLGNNNIANYPQDILPINATTLPSTYPKYMLKWFEFRAKVIHDFMEKARTKVKEVNPNIKFGVYVGGWYSTYYDVGVNWASPSYDTSLKFNWATSNYKNFGYADLMDHMLIGAYAAPLSVTGTTEWTMQGFCMLAKEKIKGDCPMVAGGPDVGNWDISNQATQEQENQAITNSVKACMDASDGYFLFDMIHLKKANQWQYVKEGIRLAIN